MTTHDPDCRLCSAKLLKQAQEADRRLRAELTQRLDRLDSFELESALRQLAFVDPDAVNEALDEVGANG